MISIKMSLPFLQSSAGFLNPGNLVSRSGTELPYLKPVFFSSRAKQSPFSTLEEVKTTINERIQVNEREGLNNFLFEDKNLIHLRMTEMDSLSAFLYKKGYGSTFFFYADNLPIIELNDNGLRDKTNSSRTGFGVRDHYYDSYYGHKN